MLLCKVVMYGVLVLLVRAEELDRQFVSWAMSRFVLSSGYHGGLITVFFLVQCVCVCVLSWSTTAFEWPRPLWVVYCC